MEISEYLNVLEIKIYPKFGGADATVLKGVPAKPQIDAQPGRLRSMGGRAARREKKN